MHIQWFPGHMTKSLRMMEESVKGVDAIGYVLDSRAPFSCFNPAFERYTEKKPCVFLLNKSDLADFETTERWIEYFSSRGGNAVALNANEKGCAKLIERAFASLEMKNVERLRQRGVARPVRIMIIGVPNSGKSSIINLLSGRKNAITGNKPGVTKGKQWIRLSDGMELLDTPGTLWSKFEDQNVAQNLFFIGSISDNVVDRQEGGLALLDRLKVVAPDALIKRYGLSEDDLRDGELLDKICLKRGCILKGEPDRERCAAALIDDFRKGTYFTRSAGGLMKLKLEYERKFIAQGKAFIAGVDEAGRGPLAGPVVAACAVMPLREGQLIDGVDDSKLLSEAKREKLFELIKEKAIEYTISVIDNREIDEINILNATKHCMKSCLEQLRSRSEIVLVDAVKLENSPFVTLPIVHGDALSYSIAAASILAKVFRDRLMREYDRQYPEYGFAKHKGYGTRAHIEALKKFGACPLHRQTFIKNFVNSADEH